MFNIFFAKKNTQAKPYASPATQSANHLPYFNSMASDLIASVSRFLPAESVHNLKNTSKYFVKYTDKILKQRLAQKIKPYFKEVVIKNIGVTESIDAFKSSIINYNFVNKYHFFSEIAQGNLKEVVFFLRMHSMLQINNCMHIILALAFSKITKQDKVEKLIELHIEKWIQLAPKKKQKNIRKLKEKHVSVFYTFLQFQKDTHIGSNTYVNAIEIYINRPMFQMSAKSFRSDFQQFF